ncbi:hypothetical protein [Streptomyces sp. I05A-00742]|uniref:hypothetical protein n=1 Tax=Streptomyces sp. I05A-00742 TaxID=2732853 RepID=UPI0014898EEF|nr:hypothetical protein [Streptomyces sp. I05A-00742]
MGWIWWAVIFGGPLAGVVGAVGGNVRAGLRTRHERKLELMEAKHKQRAELEAADKPPTPVCGCGHHLAKHDKQGKCHESVESAVAWDADKKPVAYERERCNCQQYVGPQPLTTFYAEELTELG